MRNPRILVVDDEPNIRRVVTTYLRDAGYEVAEAANGDEALARFDRTEPDLVILDVMMPGRDGIEVLQQIRRRSDVYVIMLTARSEESDRVIGLTVGADDYVTKPFSAKELVARVKAVFRRMRDRDHGSGSDDILSVGDLRIDIARRQVTGGSEPITLTALEFELLSVLASSPGRVWSRTQLLERVWGWDYVGDERVVDVHIRKLRKALGDDAAAPRFIATVRGFGYKAVEH
jgi:DNA-binding response OmpR family regulator